MKNAYEDADKHNWTKEELDAYDYALMREQDERGRIDFATKKGIKKALEQQNNSVALKLITKSYTNLEISEITGLTATQIENLRTQL